MEIKTPTEEVGKAEAHAPPRVAKFVLAHGGCQLKEYLGSLRIPQHLDSDSLLTKDVHTTRQHE